MLVLLVRIIVSGVLIILDVSGVLRVRDELGKAEASTKGNK